MSTHAQVRDCTGRFAGLRIDIERTPTVPASTGRLVLNDGRMRVLIWADPGDARRALYLAALERVDATHIRLVALAQPAVVVRLLQSPRPQGPLPLWCCPSCARTCSVLGLFGRSPDGEPRPAVGCSRCLQLHYQCRGQSRIRRTVLRSLLRIGPGQQIPRTLLVPDVVTMDLRRLPRRFRNVSFTPCPEPERGLTVKVTL